MALDEIAPEASTAAAQPSIAPPRKRRRRAPATGATEDCFTCRKRKTQCDRRRPYCSQCIELGKECSGYRTTLTWGVGVASRGKLRGKSLPVANAPKTSAISQKQNADATSPTLSTSVRSTSIPSEADARQDAGSPAAASSSYHGTPMLDPQRSAPCSSPTAMAAVSMAPSSNPNFNYPSPSLQDSFDGFYGMPAKSSSRSHFRPRPLQRLQTHFTGMFDDAPLSAPSTGSMSAFSDSDFHSPIEFPRTPDDVHFADPFSNSFPDAYGAQHSTRTSGGHFFMDVPRSYPSGPSEDLSSSLGSDFGGADRPAVSPAMSNAYFGPGTPDSYQHHHHQDLPSPHAVPEGYDYVFGPHSQPVLKLDVTSHPHDAADVPFRSSCAPNRTAVTIPKNLDTSPFRHLSLQVQSLLEYYDRMICPVLVAFDGPANPYRLHILRLATHSEGLQNAIGALSINNFRMRQMDELNGSMHCRPLQDIEQTKPPPSKEEKFYRQKAIATLNLQLADTNQATNDSVLATLLILCLFHVCDSGFSKFKTQLAGVQKLLRMRNSSRSAHGDTQNRFAEWVEMFFTWFDVLNSTVNDRETEVKGASLDMVNLSTNLGPLEHMSGCEGRLFKLIARLGRLNLLSQERPVRESDEKLTSPIGPRKRGFVDEETGTSPPKARFDVSKGDGNCWGSLIYSPTPLPVQGTPTSAMRTTVSVSGAQSFPDSRHDFWIEWRHIRSRLEAWDPSNVSTIAHNVDVDGMSFDRPHPDMALISHAFHAVAMLYTERLASPSLPPSAPAIQGHVRAALDYISRIRLDSCVNKFLLWPLFIAGTECVDWSNRNTIRERIIGVTKESGFFNNIAGLKILEEFWAEGDSNVGVDGISDCKEGARGEATASKQAFRWRKIMEKVPGEYIVV